MTHARGEVIAWIERAKPWVLGLLILALVLRATVLVVAAWPFTPDDTFITLRYAKHLAAGQGIVWNLGERPLVEGYSNFSFVLLGALAYALNLDPVLSLKIVGVLALGLTAVLIYGIARFWVTPVAALCPVAVYLAFFGPTWWAVSGMETLTYVALVLAAVFAAFRGLGFGRGLAGSGEASTAWLTFSGALVCLAAVTHPEGPLIGLAIGIGILMHRRNLPALAVFAGAAGIPYAVYFVWRSLYFHRLLPNPVYCKGGYDGDPFILVEDLAVHAGPFLLALTAAAWRRLDARHVIAIVLLLLYLAALFDVDPILAQGSRLSLAPQTVLISVACGSLLGRLSQRSAERVTIGVVVLSSVVLVYLPAELRSKALSYRSRTEARLAIGRWISETTGAGESYVMGDVGAVTYANERRMLDAYCLNSAVMTRPPINRSGERYARWLLAQPPRVIVMPSYFPDSLVPHRYMGVFPVIAEDSGFKQDYRHTRTVNVPGTIFHYWLYRRNKEE